jgi:hypothetical protein
MAYKKSATDKVNGNVEVDKKDEPTPDILSSKQEVADELKMSLYQLDQLLRRYPFENCGAPGKIMGRWKVTKINVHAWFRYVQGQELRHPDARRLRPEEPPEVAGIKGR